MKGFIPAGNMRGTQGIYYVAPWDFGGRINEHIGGTHPKLAEMGRDGTEERKGGSFTEAAQ